MKQLLYIRGIMTEGSRQREFYRNQSQIVHTPMCAHTHIHTHTHTHTLTYMHKLNHLLIHSFTYSLIHTVRVILLL